MLLLAALVAPASTFVSITLHEYEIMPSLPPSCANNRTIHLIRHAEGWHNVDELTAEREQLHLKDPQHTQLREEYGIAWMLLERVSGRKYHDPRLTPKGREQAYALRAKLRQEDNFAIDAVALSPMRRTIQTALSSIPALESASTTFALDDDAATLQPPAIVATDLLRERVGPFMPDHRLARSELEREFGALNGGASIDFSAVSEVDTMFAEGSERNEPEVGSALLASRASSALQWVAQLPEAYRSIALVSHKHFLGALTGLYPETVAQRPFENCERRTMLLCVSGDVAASGDDVGPAAVKPKHARVKTMEAPTPGATSAGRDEL